MSVSWLWARDMMASARSPHKGKPLANNTRLYDRGHRALYNKDGSRKKDSHGRFKHEDEPSYAVQFHATDVVTIHPDGTFEVNTGGWNTVTTWQRIHQYVHMKQIYDRVLWESHGRMIMLEPNLDDPEPDDEYRNIIPPVFKAHDPGPEPVWSPEGCMVGQTRVFSTREPDLIEIVNPPRYSWTDPDRLDEMDRPAPYERFYPTRARAVLGYLDDMGLKPSGYTRVSRLKYHVEHYIRENNYWALQESNGVGKAKQCPHCAEFEARHEQWRLRYEGPRWGRYAGRGFRLYAEMMERFDGDVKAWDAERKRQWREKRDAKKVWREWVLRNAVSFFDGIIINSDGYAVRSEIEARDKRKRAEQRRIRRMERERAEARRLREIELAENERKFRELHGVEAETKPGAMQWIIDHGVKINA